MGDYNLLSDTNIYKNTYHEMVCWVKELHWWVIYYRGLDVLNKTQAKRIMELEFDLRRYSSIMVEDKQETLMKEFGVAEDNVIPFEERQRIAPLRGGGSGSVSKDWLSGMEWGTQFYARLKGQSSSWMLVKFLMAGVRNKTILLVPMMGTEDVVSDDRQWLPVDPVAFCKAWELYDEFPPVPLEAAELPYEKEDE